jgi:chemotaxis protein methyltransferase CheR
VTGSLHPDRFQELADFVHRKSGIVLKPEHASSVEAKLQPLAEHWGLRGVDGLVDHLRRQRHNPAVMDEILNALTIKETSFFRDQTPFRVLQAQVLPELARAHPNRPLKLWSAACSTGQEAISLAITAWETLGRQGVRPEQVAEIVGTDVSEAAVARARQGTYSGVETARGLTTTQRDRYFEPVAEGWRLRPEWQRMIRYRPMNLLEPDFPLPQFDVVCCRNVLIYFDPEGKRRALDEVARRLRPDGYLFTGAGEDPVRFHDGFRRTRREGVQLFLREAS